MSTPFRITTGPQRITPPFPSRYTWSLHGGRALNGLATPEPLPGRYALGQFDVLDFETDWSCVLATGETIVAATFTVLLSPNGTLTLSNESFTDTTSTVWVGPGGVPENFIHVASGVTTSAGRLYDQDLTFRILAGLVPSVGGVLGGSGTLGVVGDTGNGINGQYSPYAVSFALPATVITGSGQLSASAIPSWRLAGSGHLAGAARADEFRVIGALHGGGEL
jgi:hypothetical protein